MGGCVASPVTSAIGRDRWRNCWPSSPKPARALRMFRTIGILRRVMWRWWRRSVFWRPATLRTLARFTPLFALPELTSPPDDQKAFQFRAADDCRDWAIQHPVRRRPLLLRAPQRRFASGICFGNARHSAAKTHRHLVQSPLVDAEPAVDWRV